MSDSTKMLLAKSLRELMAKRTLSRITISDICGLCEMNRKSFYYHFHDKFELINWIFRRDIASALAESPRRDPLLALCSCLQEDGSFYRAALHQAENNPLCLCMDETLCPVLAPRITSGMAEGETAALELLVHAVRSVIVQWVRGGCMQAAPEFVRTLYHAFAQLNRFPC